MHFNVINKFDYPKLSRVTHPNGVRFYTCPITSNPLASVTTILSATDDKTALIEWRNFVGEAKADKETKIACQLGELMHSQLEDYIANKPRQTGTNYIWKLAEKMADAIIAEGLCDLTEVWGSEVSMFYPGLYAGTTDLVGLYKNKPAIMDFKTTKKMKKKDNIINYRDQLAAYMIAHNEVYNTDIDLGIIFMVDREYNFQKFEFSKDEITQGKESWMERLSVYLNN